MTTSLDNSAANLIALGQQKVILVYTGLGKTTAKRTRMTIEKNKTKTQCLRRRLTNLSGRWRRSCPWEWKTTFRLRTESVNSYAAVVTYCSWHCCNHSHAAVKWIITMDSVQRFQSLFSFPPWNQIICAVKTVRVVKKLTKTFDIIWKKDIS